MDRTGSLRFFTTPQILVLRFKPSGYKQVIKVNINLFFGKSLHQIFIVVQRLWVRKPLEIYSRSPGVRTPRLRTTGTGGVHNSSAAPK